MEGRDIGTIVFPETPFKFYIDASQHVRQRRRTAEGHKIRSPFAIGSILAPKRTVENCARRSLSTARILR